MRLEQTDNRGNKKITKEIQDKITRRGKGKKRRKGREKIHTQKVKEHVEKRGRRRGRGISGEGKGGGEEEKNEEEGRKGTGRRIYE